MKRTGSALGYVGMLTTDFEPLRGLHLALTGEMLNRGKLDAEPLGDGPAREVEGPGRGDTRFGLWSTVNWFILPHLDVRVDLVTRQGRPAMLQSQLHFYL